MRWLGSRFYVPALGRFLTPDPIGQEGGLNLYAYCDNGPLMRTDPSGHDWASYLHDVGQVFMGYGDALNPVNWGKGAIGMGRDFYGHAMDNMRGGDLFAVDNALGQTGGDVLSGLWGTLTDWSTPRAFGNSWMTGSMLVAPAMKGIPNPLAWSIGDPYMGANGSFTFFTLDHNGQNMFRLDYGEITGKAASRIPDWAKGRNVLHYHRRGQGEGNGIGRHRPWQSGKGPASEMTPPERDLALRIAGLVRLHADEARFGNPSDDFGIDLDESILLGHDIPRSATELVDYAQEYFHRYTHGDHHFRGLTWKEAYDGLVRLVEQVERGASSA